MAAESQDFKFRRLPLILDGPLERTFCWSAGFEKLMRYRLCPCMLLMLISSANLQEDKMAPMIIWSCFCGINTMSFPISILLDKRAPWVGCTGDDGTIWKLIPRESLSSVDQRFHIRQSRGHDECHGHKVGE